jgi:transcriptional regulator with XRE-family HTH domain
MIKDCDNRYKISRETAGMTQAVAAELLHVSERSLSDYENGKTRVPDDIVAAMADTYNSPLLAWWHLKTTSILGKYLPDLVMPQTSGDMAFQLVLAQDELEPVVCDIKKILSDGVIDGAERVTFADNIKAIKRVNGKLISVVAFAEQHDETEGGRVLCLRQ